MFLVGPGVAPGLHGPAPDLADLEDGDVRSTVDFRAVYATVLERWLGCSSKGALGGEFETLPLLRG